MKILVTGKNGQVGFELRRALSVVGNVFAVGSADCDLCDELAIRKLVREVQPDIIVNPAAYTAVDRAESDMERAAAVNSHAPRVLAEEAERTGAMLIHFSTDYVFDGSKHGAYTETDHPNPQTIYGATKLAGEAAVQAVCSRFVILRTSWVLGTHGANFAKTMLRLATEKDELKVVADQLGVPTTAAFLADVSAHLIRQAQRDGGEFPYGLYHTVPGGETNWHAYACHVIERARASGHPIRVPAANIHPICTKDYPTPARRPANSTLDHRKLHDTFGFNLPHWQDGVDHVLENIL